MRMNCKAFVKSSALSLFCVASLVFSTAAAQEFAYLTPGLDLPFWRYLATGIEDTAVANEATLNVYDSGNDAATQLRNAQDAIARGVAGIILSPTDSSTAPSILSLAERAGIPVVIADIGTESGEYVSFIISDNYDGAYQVGEYLAEQLEARGWPSGPVGLVTISLARLNGQNRTEGFRQAMTEAGVEEAALQQMQRYTADETLRYVQDMLTANPDLHGIFVQTDTPTLGAVRGISAARRDGDVLLAAFDGVPEFVPLIESGQIIASGMQQPYLMGQTSMQAMLDHLAGNEPEKEILIPIILVTQDNLEEVLPTITESVFANELQ